MDRVLSKVAWAQSDESHIFYLFLKCESQLTFSVCRHKSRCYSGYRVWNYNDHKSRKKGTGTQWDTGDVKAERWAQRVEGSTVGQGHGKEGVEMGNQQKHLLLKDDIGNPNSFMLVKKKKRKEIQIRTL